MCAADETTDAKAGQVAARDKSQSNDDNKQSSPQTTTTVKNCFSRLVQFYWDNEFLMLILIAIALARAYPPLGAEYLKPDITATWLAVCIIFFMAGLELKTEEFSKAFQRFQFNLFVQVFNFGVVSSIVYAGSRGLDAAGILSQDLADGMVICSCLPVTINMVLVLTKSSGGDEAAAIFHAAFGNMVGVFLSPVLILGYLGVTADIALGEVFFKLTLRVVVPVIVGQILQKSFASVREFVKSNKKRFKVVQQYILVFIVYTVFCETFDGEGSGSSIGEIFLMIVFQFIFLVGFNALAWYSLGLFFRDEPKLRVMGIFGCTQKTVAVGVPLINAIYENNPAIGLYTLPLLIWHPMQLVVGTFLSPRLAAFVKREEERLGLNLVEAQNAGDPGETADGVENGQAIENAEGDHDEETGNQR